MNTVDCDSDKFEVDAYGNLIPKDTKNEKNVKDGNQEQSK